VGRRGSELKGRPTKRWQWEWGGRGGVAFGIIVAVLVPYFVGDFGALIFIPVAAVFMWRVVSDWSQQGHQNVRTRRWTLTAIIVAVLILEVMFPLRSLDDTYRARKIVGHLIEQGNAINSRWTEAYQGQNQNSRRVAEEEINEWRKVAAADLSRCPFQGTVWAHDVETQSGNLIALEVVRLHTVRDHVKDFLDPKCFTVWR